MLPIDDRTVERVNPALAGRPDLLGDRSELTLYPGMDGILENTFMNVKNRSMTVTAELVIPEGGANGVILAQGGRFGGWSLYAKDGQPAYVYNWLGLERYTVAAPGALPSGRVTLVLDFAYDGGGPGKPRSDSCCCGLDGERRAVRRTRPVGTPSRSRPSSVYFRRCGSVSCAASARVTLR